MTADLSQPPQVIEVDAGDLAGMLLYCEFIVNEDSDMKTCAGMVTSPPSISIESVTGSW